jgi:hypothetical protein
MQVHVIYYIYIYMCVDELYAPDFFSFYIWWPDDGLFRPKLAANILNNNIKR